MLSLNFSIGHLAVICLLVGILTGCQKDNDDQMPDDFITKFGGTPFKGDASSLLLRPDNSSYEWEGKATVALIEAEGDSVSIVFRADFDNEGEINFKVRGARQGMNFHSTNGESYFRVIDSDISGSIKNDIQDISFDGDLTESRAFMDMKVVFLETMDIFPKGSTMTISFRTSREVDNDNDGSGCQMRMVPIWGPNGMTMGMVPDC